ncbi:MAG TPA: ankyrin repeat domain-containing protein [Tetrasphaera sp.]|uniref:Ankyrin repeat domain-containing protein n=1 Tax=Nostocoides vanveenii TaxID=330835 RepID=A0ABP4WI30_9MICO|nr:ankyrin repeat domain-containing protein [Tetrasphaera sp.]HNQ05565.1 ankyrin repeat domain-containing protein [Tetrasphaera sp.]
MTREHLDADQQARIVEIALDLAREGRTDELVEFLDHGLPVDVTGPNGDTALMLAAYHGHAGLVRTLIDRGANLNALNARGQSIIAGAIFKGENEIVRALVAAGADLDAGTPSARETAAIFGRAELLARGAG